MTFNGGDPSGDALINVFAGVTQNNNKWNYKSIFHSDGKQKSILGTFTVTEEDYTVGELLKHEMSNHKEVLSQGYIVPHPLEPILKIHCRTVDTTTPPKVLDECFSSIIAKIKAFKDHLDSSSSQARLASENKGSTITSVT